jgi:glutathione S-transferase
VKLYFFPVAPNPTKVLLYLAEKALGGGEIAIEQVPVDVRKGEQRSPEHLARNPFGRLPVLELDDGTYLTESLAIIEYLEETHPIPNMLGRTPVERARVRELERIADLGVLVLTAWVIHGTNSPLGLPPNPQLVEFCRPRLARALEVLDRKLADGRTFLAGDEPTIADCTLAAALQFGRYGSVPLPDSLEHLTCWDRMFRARASASRVLRY